MKIILDNGKYTYINDGKGQRALRYGEPWRDLVGDNLTLAMAHKIEDQNEIIDNLKSLLGSILRAPYETDCTSAITKGSYMLEASKYLETLNQHHE